VPGPKTLLLQSPITLKESDVASFGLFPPLGLAYLAAALLREGFQVEICDLLAEGAERRERVGEGRVRLGLPDAEVEQLLRDKAPDIVGIANCFSSFSDDAVRLARLVRGCLPDALVVMGGAHASVEFAPLLATGVVDAAVVGEGEETFADVVRAIAGGRPEAARGVAGTVWRIGDEVRENAFRAPPADLDALPFPAWPLLPMERYIWQRKANFAAAMRWPIGHMITSRGCLYNCLFCSVRRRFRKFRVRSAANVLAEMELLMRDYGIREFHFHDDCFLARPERVRELCQAILDRKLDIRWQVSQGINSDRLDDDLLELMARSGMYRVGFPIESACRETLRFIRKPVKPERVRQLIEKCNRLGIYVFGCFMIGFPEETRDQIEETLEFAVRSGLDYAKVSAVQPIPGSELFSVFERLGLLAGGLRQGSTYFHTEYDTVHLSAADLNALRARAMRRFAVRRITRMLSQGGLRRFLLPKLRSREQVGYFLRMAWHALRGL